MKLTKFNHACFVVEKNNQSIIIDPGEFTHDLTIPESLVGVIVTHKHSDHAGQKQIDDIVRRYPNVTIFSTDDFDLQLPHQIVNPSDKIQLADFLIEFSGGEHAIIDKSIPRIANLAVLIDQHLYYPGDSFANPPKAISSLLLPVSAPWMKISEALEFVRETKPSLVIPTHDGILSEAGQAIVDRLVGNLCNQLGITYSRLASGQTLNII